MKSVVVRYRVREDHVAANLEAIGRVMADHAAAARPGVRYCVSPDRDDPQTFIHMGIYATEADLEVATGLASFKAFQAALRASRPVEPPRANWGTLIGAGFVFPG